MSEPDLAPAIIHEKTFIIRNAPQHFERHGSTVVYQIHRKTCVSCFSKQGICTADSHWTEHSSIQSLGDIRPLRPL